MYVYIGLQLAIGLILLLILQINPLALNTMDYKLVAITILPQILPIVIILKKFKIKLWVSESVFYKDWIYNASIGVVLGGIAVAIVILLQNLLLDSFVIHPVSSINRIEIFIWFFLILLAAFFEELFFRFILHKILGKGWDSLFLSSILFMLMHSANPGINIVSVVNVFLFGVLMWLIYEKSKSLILVTFIHGAWNYTCGFVFGTNISGLGAPLSFFNTSSIGSQLVSGGNFGIEASLITSTLLVFVLAILLFMSFKKKTKTIND